MEFLSQDKETYVDILLPQNVDSATLCLRFFTDMRHHECLLFSMVTPVTADAFTLSREKEGQYGFYYNTSGYPVRFGKLPEKRSAWNSICVTWDAAEGLAQVWLNEGRSAIKRSQYGPGSLSGSNPRPPRVTLGREKLDYDKNTLGRFRYFVGELKDLHMWDYVLDACEIKKYMVHSKTAEPFSPGNVINWKSLTYTPHGDVNIIKDEYDCQ